MAYRKVKVDLFYSSRLRRRELLNFESDLEANLKRLRARLREGRAPTVPADAWTVVPKRMDEPALNGFADSDAEKQWELLREKKPEAVFRLMENLPIGFHVFATLWINIVGHQFDKCLSEDVRGNRLRRVGSGRLNRLALGSHPPYVHPYRKWRDDGMSAIRSALENGRSVIAVTADASSFYHMLDPAFMLDDNFMGRVGVGLEPNEMALHTAFIGALREWSQATPLGRGLPVGLVASSVIANLALIQLDSAIKSEVAPLYYGRYVDDIILVVEDGAALRSSEAVWDWLCQRMPGLLVKRERNKGKKRKAGYRFQPLYLEGSKVEFANGKNKTFALSGQSGLSLLTSIEKQIRNRASEWLALPELPTEGATIESDLLSAIQTSGEFADSLRKADSVSVQRAAFAFKLRDVEAYSRALSPDDWAARRHAFLDAMIRHVLVLPALFQFFGYLPRMIELAGINGDVEYLRKIVGALEKVLKDLKSCRVSIAGMRKSRTELAGSVVLSRFEEEVRQVVAQCVETSFRYPQSSTQKGAWSRHFAKDLSLLPKPDPTCLRKAHQSYFRRDLACRPVKQLLMPAETIAGNRTRITKRSLSQLNADSAARLVDDAVVKGALSLSGIIRVPCEENLPVGFLFPTRPPSVYEIYVLHEHAFTPEGSEEIAVCLLGLRGFTPEQPLPARSSKRQSDPIVIPQGDGQCGRVRIAVSSWRTDQRSWVASVSQRADPDKTRLDRLFRLVSAVIGCREKPDYLILPECSLPPSWFLGIAIRLQRKGISLIGGVEYLHRRRGAVQNQTWACLSHDALGFPSFMHYSQDKQRPSLHEEAKLKRVAGKVLKPKARSKWDSPPVLSHGGLHFAILVCSELTNIRYRADLRGEVDALFVPEWNRDADTFDSLIESAALDMHAYIVQCNDREHGDSRIRVPHKNAWERDIVRVKGGVEDYFVVGEIDLLALRQFQSNFRSPEGPFKPVPDGFKMNPQRKVLPAP